MKVTDKKMKLEDALFGFKISVTTRDYKEIFGRYYG